MIKSRDVQTGRQTNAEKKSAAAPKLIFAHEKKQKTEETKSKTYTKTLTNYSKKATRTIQSTIEGLSGLPGRQKPLVIREEFKGEYENECEYSFTFYSVRRRDANLQHPQLKLFCNCFKQKQKHEKNQSIMKKEPKAF